MTPKFESDAQHIAMSAILKVDSLIRVCFGILFGKSIKRREGITKNKILCGWGRKNSGVSVR